MSKIENRISNLGLVLPEETKVPPGVELLFPWVNVRGNRVFVSGHAPTNPYGTIATPLGRVGDNVSVEDAAELAGKTALAMLTSLKGELGDLDRITGWARVFGMVNCDPDFDQHPQVIDGFSKVILDVFGPEIGRHARSAVGMSSLPMGFAVEIEAEVIIG